MCILMKAAGCRGSTPKWKHEIAKHAANQPNLTIMNHGIPMIVDIIEGKTTSLCRSEVGRVTGFCMDQRNP
jgi:hypothetical protein